MSPWSESLPTVGPVLPAFDTVGDAFAATVTAHADDIALRSGTDAREWTWRAYADEVVRTATGLYAHGIRRGDTVALMLANRPEFHICDVATLHLGATPYSIYNTEPVDGVHHRLVDAAPRVVVTETAFVDVVLAAAELPGAVVEHVVVIDGERPGTLPFAQLQADADAALVADAARAVRPDDLATLIYTSGTTGRPKTVQLTHRNVLSSARALAHALPFPRRGRTVSYSPTAHISERICSLYIGTVLAFDVTCCPDPGAWAQYVRQVHPTWLSGAPRVWEKLAAALEAELRALDPGERAAVEAGIERGLRCVEHEQRGEPVPDALLGEWRAAERTALRAFRARVGIDDVAVAICGAASIRGDLVGYFQAIGIPLMTVWGMSETSGSGTVNRIPTTRNHTSGIATDTIEIRIAEDREILVRGEVVMREYRNDPEANAAAYDADGWFRTGDLGSLDDDGFLTVTGRKKELIVSASGKNMSPTHIEHQLKSASALITHAVAIGDGHPYNVALLVLDPVEVGALLGRSTLSRADLASVLDHPELRQAIADAVARANARLSRPEQVKRYFLLTDEWEPGTALMTGTMKLRREQIHAAYAKEIMTMYEAPRDKVAFA